MTVRQLIKRLMNCEDMDKEIQIIINADDGVLNFEEEDYPLFAEIERVYDDGNMTICDVG